MGAVELSDVRKVFGALEVIHGVSIDISDGEFVTLVGPSGCGKSTLLRMIAGLEDISGGRISVAGEVVNDLPPKDRNIAMVFQSYALYPHMNVADNLGFSLRINKIPRQERDRRIAEAARILGLEDYLARYPRQLSGGQRQRVAMGRAIVRDPQVFLFDEPLSNLDAKLRVSMRSEIKALHQRLGSTMVYVTHDQVEAMTMADRIVVMREGVVEQIGTPLELYDHPANTFVASFIGSPSMNLLSGTLEEEGFVAADGTRVPLQGVPRNSGDAVLGIRPEHLHVDPEGMSARVITVEPTGSETYVSLRLADTDLVRVFRDRLLVNPGDELRLSFDPHRMHLFESSGARL